MSDLNNKLVTELAKDAGGYTVLSRISLSLHTIHFLFVQNP